MLYRPQHADVIICCNSFLVTNDWVQGFPGILLSLAHMVLDIFAKIIQNQKPQAEQCYHISTDSQKYSDHLPSHSKFNFMINLFDLNIKNIYPKMSNCSFTVY